MSSFKNFAPMLSSLQDQADGKGTIAGSPLEDFLSIAGYETPDGRGGGGGGGGIPVFWQIDSTTIGVDGDFASCLAKLQQGIPIVAAYYTSPVITSESWLGDYPALCGCSYDASSPDEIRIRINSNEYLTWTANGVS